MDAYQGRFFPEVRAIAGNDNTAGNMAFPAFTRKTVGTATPWTQTAFLEDGFGFGYPFT